MVNWRWRRCPRCHVVERASDFPAVRPYRGWGTGAVARECPTCGYEAETWAFRVVRERHAASWAVPAAVSVGSGAP